jgi:hypothetical protein
MNNQEICRFVNSKDIRKYLADINYSFTPAEAAWLVYQCRDATLAEKYDAWEKIIATMPDQSVDSLHFDKPYESIHKVISDFIAMKKDVTDMFLKEAPNAFYQYSLVYNDGSRDYDDSMLYSSYKKCFKQLERDLSEEDDDTTSGCIRRSEIDCIYHITAYYNKKGELMDVDIPADYGIVDWNLLDFFRDLWFHFPAPFKKGDIIYDPLKHQRRACEDLLVMECNTPLKFEEDGRSHTDSSDMNVWGYFQDEETGTIFHEVTWNYMDFEYFPEEQLTGKKRILKALSNLLKEEIDIELFTKAYHLIILEETRNDLMPRGWFTEEGMKLAGIWEEKNYN